MRRVRQAGSRNVCSCLAAPLSDSSRVLTRTAGSQVGGSEEVVDCDQIVVNIKRLQEDVKILRDDVEKLKDSNRNMIYQNGNGKTQ